MQRFATLVIPFLLMSPHTYAIAQLFLSHHQLILNFLTEQSTDHAVTMILSSLTQ